MKKLIALALSLAPVSVFAQQITDANSLTTKITNIGNTVVVLLISFSVIYIIFNVVRYLIADSEDGRKKGGLSILWGVVGLFVILSIWGLVAILTNTFSTNNNVPREKFPTVIPPPAF
ncbi:MAG: pilin [Patescibacteria group bacterium]